MYGFFELHVLFKSSRWWISIQLELLGYDKMIDLSFPGANFSSFIQEKEDILWSTSIVELYVMIVLPMSDNYE